MNCSLNYTLFVLFYNCEKAEFSRIAYTRFDVPAVVTFLFDVDHEGRLIGAVTEGAKAYAKRGLALLFGGLDEHPSEPVFSLRIIRSAVRIGIIITCPDPSRRTGGEYMLVKGSVPAEGEMTP